MKKIVSIFVVAFLVPWLVRADESSPKQFYNLDFVVQELDGTRVVNSREYSTIAATNSPSDCYIRTNSKVTMALASGRAEYDIGVTIDAKGLRESPGGLSLEVSAAIMSLAPDVQTDAVPILRRHQWASAVQIATRKPAVVFSSDDVSSKHKIQLVLTATPIK